jgi:hypothetical protein
MAASASLAVAGTITGLPSGTATIALTLANATASGQELFTTLASGANSITVPSGTKWVIIVPPAGNSTTLTFKGVTGDTGVVLHPTEPAIISLASSVSTFCLTASALMTSPTLFQFV